MAPCQLPERQDFSSHRSVGSVGAFALTQPGTRFCPTLGWGKQSIWLAASGRQTHSAGRSPHPLLPRNPSACSSTEQPSRRPPCDSRVAPVCRFRGRGGTVPLKREFRRCWAVCGVAAVRGSHDAVILSTQNIQFQRGNVPRRPRFGPSGGVRFSY